MRWWAEEEEASDEEVGDLPDLAALLAGHAAIIRGAQAVARATPMLGSRVQPPLGSNRRILSRVSFSKSRFVFRFALVLDGTSVQGKTARRRSQGGGRTGCVNVTATFSRCGEVCASLFVLQVRASERSARIGFQLPGVEKDEAPRQQDG